MPVSGLPTRSIRSTRTTGTLVVLVLAACGEPSSPPPRSAPVSASVVGASGIRPAEARLHELARDVPGFGGYFIDSTGLTVAYVTDLARGEALRRRVLQLTRAGHPGPTAARVEIRKGDFDFPSLAHWRDIVSDQLLGVIPGVVMSDADEAANRVTVGIDDARHPGARGEVMRALARLGVPLAAVRLVVSGQVSPAVASPPLTARAASMMLNQSLTDVPSPLVAGYLAVTPDLGHGCTFGPVVNYNGRAAVLLNSHCTSTTYGYDGSTIYTTDFAAIGSEGIDPGAQCGSGCRRSDAALIYLSTGVSFDVGRIARTTNVTYTWGSAGSLAVDQSNPTSDIVAVAAMSDVVSGMSVFKTGRTTGTTGGTVSNTCADILATDGLKRDCTITSTYYVAGGDSGSPMYANAPGAGGVRLIGIVWGADSTGHRGNSSYMYWVTSEISGSYVIAHSTPLGVYISGPSDVNNSASCRLAYQAVATGGGEGYSYSWSTDGVITEDYGDVVYAAFPDTPDGRYIEVTVTSADGSSQTADLTVNSSAMYDMCNS